MGCDFPLTAYFAADIGKSGKRGVTFSRGASFSGQPLRLPCGQCTGCRLEYSRQWAMRCMHERSLWRHNEFVTLTYEDKYLPPGGTLVKRDLQLFMKRLRKAYGKGIRFYACGEYGELNRRPHYHAIVFNWLCEDKEFYSRSRRGDTLYTSARLSELWPYGFNVVGDVTFESCAYVARYVMKKFKGDGAAEHYRVVDGDGVVYDRAPEFVNMSRRPGIGTGWFEKYGEHAYAWDSVIMNGREVRPPRFYDVKVGQVDSEKLDGVKRKRRRRVKVSENKPERRRVRAAVRDAKMSLTKRSL